MLSKHRNLRGMIAVHKITTTPFPTFAFLEAPIGISTSDELEPKGISKTDATIERNQIYRDDAFTLRSSDSG
jgi:hypothetical protein